MGYSVLDNLLKNFKVFSSCNAFYIEGNYYTYNDFKARILHIQDLILNQCTDDDKNIGIYSFNDLETYAAIYASWYSGKTFIPINPFNPAARNESILKQSGIKFILHSKEIPGSSLSEDSNHVKIDTSGRCNKGSGEIVKVNVSEESFFYIIFTSGSTGDPKGVPISRHNLNTFVKDFIEYGYSFTNDDRFLQIYDLSFDASVHCYTVPLSVGACVYTVPQDQIRYLYAYKLMSEKKLSFVKMPPSTLAYLKPYFESVNLPHLKYCLLGGEAFPLLLAEAWSKAVPGAIIQNVYGPTEVTINCLIYEWKVRNESPASYAGVVSIGNTFGSNKAVIVDENLKLVPDGEKGELCITGDQVTSGYWRNDAKTAETFFEMYIEGANRRFYRTGDLAFRNIEGEYMYCGRMDAQVQIQGYRVELGEIESHARDFLQMSNLACVSRENHQGITEIFLILENAEDKEDQLKSYLQSKLPRYMIPRKIINFNELPKSAGGKINKSEILKLLNHEL